MGSYGKIDRSAYPSQRTSPESIATLENAVAAWLSSKPGAFSSQGPCDLYDKALAQFMRHSDRRDTRDAFEIALARLGYRAGVAVYDGAPFWFLILPSSLDTALTRMAAMEVRSA